jgi:malate dehydrogenase (oxaloacetate-decarboxylating)
LFKKFANVDAFPICLDTQDPEEIIRTVKLLSPVFGGINLEDISAPRCFEIEERLKAELNIPVMHDDQHGTAVVVLAALINALNLVDKDKQKVKIVINGAGAAGMAIAKLLKHFGFLHIIACDSVGIIHSGRQNLTPEKQAMLEYTNPESQKGLLSDAIKDADVFIGVSKASLLNSQDVKTMAEKSIVFAMANPIPEILMEEAKAGGAYIYASGRSDIPNQINNVLAFPGLFRGALDNRIKSFTTDHFIQAAKNIAALVTSPSVDCIIPSPFTPGLAEAVAKSLQTL